MRGRHLPQQRDSAASRGFAATVDSAGAEALVRLRLVHRVRSDVVEPGWDLVGRASRAAWAGGRQRKAGSRLCQRARLFPARGAQRPQQAATLRRDSNLSLTWGTRRLLLFIFLRGFIYS